jgi:hypothetical protein
MAGVTGEQQKSCVVLTRQMTRHVFDLLNYSLALVMEQEANVAGDDSPKGTGGRAPPPPSLRTTRVGRRGGEARCARRVPQRSPARAWADGDFDADHGFDLDGVGRSVH